MRLLIVEPDSTLRRGLEAAAELYAQVDACRSFEAAKARLRAESSYDLLVTNVRLHAYNGLHLVYLAKLAAASTAAIVYDERANIWLAAEVRRACAFYEIGHRLLITLPRYIGAALPPADRRDPLAFDRRQSPRGGRRLWDRRQTATRFA